MKLAKICFLVTNEKYGTLSIYAQISCIYCSMSHRNQPDWNSGSQRWTGYQASALPSELLYFGSLHLLTLELFKMLTRDRDIFSAVRHFFVLWIFFVFQILTVPFCLFNFLFGFSVVTNYYWKNNKRTQNIVCVCE